MEEELNIPVIENSFNEEVPVKTIEKVLSDFMNFYFIDLQTLQPNQEKIQQDITEEKDEAIQTANASGLLWEELEVCKLITIDRWLNQKEGFYQERFYKQITDTVNRRDVECDEMGVIENVGISMSEEEFNIYKQAYNQLYLEWKNKKVYKSNLSAQQ